MFTKGSEVWQTFVATVNAPVPIPHPRRVIAGILSSAKPTVDIDWNGAVGCGSNGGGGREQLPWEFRSSRPAKPAMHAKKAGDLQSSCSNSVALAGQYTVTVNHYKLQAPRRFLLRAFQTGCQHRVQVSQQRNGVCYAAPHHGQME